MISAEDRGVVLRALKENLVTPDQVLVCIWDIEAHARGASWERTLPMRLVANGYLHQNDFLRLRASAASETRPAGPGHASTRVSVATPPGGLTPVPTPPASAAAAADPPADGGNSHPAPAAHRPRPTSIDHAVSAWLQQRGIVPPDTVRNAFRIQQDYAPFGISLPLSAVIRRLGALDDNHHARLNALPFSSITEATSWRSQAVPGWPILGKIATGGCSTLFRAREAFTGRTVALKILQRRLWNDPVSLERFESEGRLLTQLKHPNLVRGLAFGTSPTGLPYTSLALVPGEPADRMLNRNGSFPVAFALHVTRRVADALAHLHQAGYVHGDVKPENILVGDRQAVTLCDLHLAQRISRERTAPSERTSGTAAYMSPEQARGETNLGAESDIYALGLTLYAMISGRCPFEGEDPHAVLERRFREGTGAPDLDGLTAPPSVIALLRRMLQPDRHRRYGDTAALLKTIAELRT